MNRPVILALILAWAVAGFAGEMATTIGLINAEFSYAVGGLALLAALVARSLNLEPSR